ncbi:MAG: hypothetical protein AAGF75_04105, partial [Cyanobacteria bacterium P01_H01_bin.130]
MTSPSDPTPQSEPPESSEPRSPWWQRSPRGLKYGLYGTALGVTAVVAGGAGFGWYWIHYQLPGFVSQTVSDLL